MFVIYTHTYSHTPRLCSVPVHSPCSFQQTPHSSLPVLSCCAFQQGVKMIPVQSSHSALGWQGIRGMNKGYFQWLYLGGLWLLDAEKVKSSPMSHQWP